jgi:predicted lipoprotein with Yx(FWY)xxD motif
MGVSGECAGIRSQLGVYLTGSIAPADRAAVVRHLAACEDCRAELAGLAALPGLLRRPASAQAAVWRPGDDADPGEALLGRVAGGVARRRRRRRWLLAAAAVALVAVAGAGWALRLAEPPGPRVPGTVLETEHLDGVTVLANAEGYTLYWFGPDSASRSACDADCARSWPPVTGPAVAGAGLAGTFGAITRPDGSLQATYDGHPLYTATMDTSPGQARGDDVWSYGGVWHEVTVRGR